MAQFSDKPSILAPAGNPDALMAAVFNGADAVYLGLNKFNARMKADNFTTENLPEWVNFCHLFNVKVFVTINTCIKNSEFKEACQLGRYCYENFVDGLIVTDIGLLRYLKDNCPDFDVTLSTQQNIHNVAGAKIAEELGCSRVVVSRETPLADIEKIHERVGIDVEAFLHGALCVSVSGQCLFSSFIDGNSGNRGLCAQPCRQKYDCIVDGQNIKTGYLLSARDLCLIRNVGKLADCGVKMLKIEGRNRRAQYVAQTTKTYRKVIDDDYTWTDNDLYELKTIYNRGNYTNGYINNNANIVYPQAQGHIGVKVGTLVRNGKEWFIKGNRFLHEGDAFKVLRDDIEVGNAICIESSKNGLAKVGVCGDCKTGDDINITTSVAQISQLDAIKKSLSVEVFFCAKAGHRAKIQLLCNGVSVLVESTDVLDKAQNQPITKENIVKQISKTGNTHYTISKIIVDIDDVFLPLSLINTLRRKGLSMLDEELILRYNLTLKRNPINSTAACNNRYLPTNKSKRLCLYVDESFDDTVYGADTLIVFKPNEYNLNLVKTFVPTLNANAIYLDTPNFATESDYAVLKSILKTGLFEGVVANNLYAVYLARELGLKIVIGLGLNVFNNEALNSLKLLCGENYFSFFYSQELSLAEINEFEDKEGFIFTDGEICLMTLAHCPLHVNSKCDCGHCRYNGKDLVYRDKTNRCFHLRRKRIAKCYWELFNCLPLVGDEKIDFSGNYLLKPNPDSRSSVYKLYQQALNAKSIDKQDVPHTTGHLVKKVK